MPEFSNFRRRHDEIIPSRALVVNALVLEFGYGQRRVLSAEGDGIARGAHHHHFATRAQARIGVFDYIETFYNRIRLRSSLAYRSLINFESKPN